jgi:SAM-dependent methyltransferase
MSLELSVIKQIREGALNNEIVAPDYGYQAARGGETRSLTPVDPASYEKTYKNLERVWASYDIALPHTHDINVSGEIQRRVGSGRTVRMLDIGCGAGVFLVDIKKKYGDDVECVGVTVKDFTGLYFTDETRSQKYEELVDNFGIKIIYGDAQRLIRILQQNNRFEPFDIITAQGSLHYMGDPLAVVKQGYRMLREPDDIHEGGIMFVGLDGHSSLDPLQQINEHLVSSGYDITLVPHEFKDVPGTKSKQSSGGVIVRRNDKKRLILPLSYSGIFSENLDPKGENGTMTVLYESTLRK